MSSESKFGLTPPEEEIVQCLVQGLSNREIEDKLGLSAHTVKFHLFRIFDKMGVSSRVELLRVATDGAMTERTRPKIIIANDHTLVAEACKKLLDAEYDVVATVGGWSRPGASGLHREAAIDRH